MKKRTALAICALLLVLALAGPAAAESPGFPHRDGGKRLARGGEAADNRFAIGLAAPISRAAGLLLNPVTQNVLQPVAVVPAHMEAEDRAQSVIDVAAAKENALLAHELICDDDLYDLIATAVVANVRQP